jgi:hypothetical protein
MAKLTDAILLQISLAKLTKHWRLQTEQDTLFRKLS